MDIIKLIINQPFMNGNYISYSNNNINTIANVCKTKVSFVSNVTSHIQCMEFSSLILTQITYNFMLCVILSVCIVSFSFYHYRLSHTKLSNRFLNKGICSVIHITFLYESQSRAQLTGR